MRSIPIVILILFLSLCVIAQETNESYYKGAFGIDASFINSLLPLDNDIGISSPYLFSFRKYQSPQEFIRFNTNLNFRFFKEDNEDEVSGEDSSVAFDFRVGKGKEQKLYKKLSFVRGYDFLTSLDWDRSVTSTATTENKLLVTNVELGGGVFFGFQYQIVERLFVFIEANYYLSIGREVQKFKNQQNPNLDFTRKKFELMNRIVLPRSIVLFYQF